MRVIPGLLCLLILACNRHVANEKSFPDIGGEIKQSGKSMPITDINERFGKFFDFVAGADMRMDVNEHYSITKEILEKNKDPKAAAVSPQIQEMTEKHLRAIDAVRFQSADENNDDYLSKTEYLAQPNMQFSKLDTDHDQQISLEEVRLVEAKLVKELKAPVSELNQTIQDLSKAGAELERTTN